MMTVKTYQQDLERDGNWFVVMNTLILKLQLLMTVNMLVL